MLCSSFSECIEYDGLMGTRVIFVIRSRLGMGVLLHSIMMLIKAQS